MQLQLIEDLLDTARIIGGKLRLDVRPIDIASVIDDALDVVRPAAEAKGVRLRTADSRSSNDRVKITTPIESKNQDQTAPGENQFAIPESQSAIVLGDATRLQQVVWNLLTNAIKFTPNGGRVELRIERDADCILIIVSDTGKGVEPEFLPHVFDRFYQADRSSMRRHGGLGLGLALVKSLVELHGGEIRAESEGEGRGSTFTVTLPLAINSGMTAMETPALASFAGAASGARTEGAISLPEGVTIEGVRGLAVDDQEEARVTSG
jgi:signal transduction histidine kinase